MHKILATGLGLFLLVTAGLVERGVAQETVRVRIGTAAPRGSIWHEILEQVQQDWERISDGSVRVQIYPGGVQGDESAMLDKVRAGVLQAVALSGAGLSQADRGVSALDVPMMMASYEELDYVRERMAPAIERRLESQGLVVLNWSDAGWVRFFSKVPVETPDDIRGLRLFTSAGDAESEQLYRDLNLRPVPSGVNDMVTNLQTGSIEAFAVPPLFAAADQSFALAPHMLDLRFAPVLGATLIDRETWERIPAALSAGLLRAAREATSSRRDEIRRLGDEAIEAMKANGLQVTPVSSDLADVWRRETEAVWPTWTGRIVPEDLFEEALRLRDEFRAQSN